MIHRLSSDLPTFKTVDFHHGLNVVIAERTTESTVKDSRNGVGKSTLIEIIHFCLGGGIATGKPKTLFQEVLAKWTFNLELDLRDSRYTVSRKGENPNRIIVQGDFSNVPNDWQPKIERETGEQIYSLQEWTNVLGWMIFDIPFPKTKEIYLPTFRSLISYFIRKGKDAYSKPFEHFRKQLEWDKQVNNSYLLGMGWNFAREFQLNKDNEKDVKQLEKSAKSGVLASLAGDLGELEADKVNLEDRSKLEEQQLKSFNVHPQYREINEKANSLTKQLHEIENLNVSDQRMIDYYENSIKNEVSADDEKILKIYTETGILLPDVVSKKLEDVKNFHQQVVNNRREFLLAEIVKLKQRIIERSQNSTTFSSERAELMQILKTHGALAEYTKLQDLHTKTITALQTIKQKIQQLKLITERKGSLKIERTQLQQQTQLDYDQRSESISHAISLFNSNTEALYERAGRLIINVEAKGYDFDTQIDRKGSGGVENMEVFCYDLALAQIWAEKNISPIFLVHDSIIFEGVDERQKALAIELAEKKAKDLNFQYICCINSDAIPRDDFSEGFNIYQFTCRELNDGDDAGTLLGFRFR